MMKLSLTEFIINEQTNYPYSTGELTNLLNSISIASKKVSALIRKGNLLDGFSGDSGQINAHGEQVQQMDTQANNIFIEVLRNGRNVCGIVSEENKNEITFNLNDPNRKYIIMMDPMDGSSNVDVNIPVGTIFSIYRRISDGNELLDEDFLQAGKEQVAAGYVLYGSSTVLVYSTGSTVDCFTLDPEVGEFFLTKPNLKFHEKGNIYSINEGYANDFSQHIKDYLLFLKSKKVKARYIGSLVADFHRSLLKGGIFLYPPTKEAPKGKLRLLYECNPLAFIAQVAGGKALNDQKEILNIVPTSIHEKSSLVIGDPHMIKEYESYLSGDNLKKVI